MVMVNHAAYPETPGKARPASVSAYWIQTVLRRKIGYRGIAFSDDLEMGGILEVHADRERPRSLRCERGWIWWRYAIAGADFASL